MKVMKVKFDNRKHDWDVKLADRHAERLDREASFAVEYAAASIEQAKLAVLDAIVGHFEAEKARSSQYEPTFPALI